jgi:hypothetical protein
MEIIKTVEVKRFNSDLLKGGTPVKVTYFPNSEQEQVDYGFITKNLGHTLVYTTWRQNNMFQYEVDVVHVGRGVIVEIGTWSFNKE